MGYGGPDAERAEHAPGACHLHDGGIYKEFTGAKPCWAGQLLGTPCAGRSWQSLISAGCGRTRRGLQRVLKHLDLLDDGEVVVVGRHAQHQPVLHVQRDLAHVAVLADQRVQRVAVRHPADQACARTYQSEADAARDQQAERTALLSTPWCKQTSKGLQRIAGDCPAGQAYARPTPLEACHMEAFSSF